MPIVLPQWRLFDTRVAMACAGPIHSTSLPKYPVPSVSSVLPVSIPLMTSFLAFSSLPWLFAIIPCRPHDPPALCIPMLIVRIPQPTTRALPCVALEQQPKIYGSGLCAAFAVREPCTGSRARAPLFSLHPPGVDHSPTRTTLVRHSPSLGCRLFRGERPRLCARSSLAS